MDRHSAGTSDGEALHRLLFPVGARQRAALNLAGHASHEAGFLAIHRGIAWALEQAITRHDPSPSLANWLLLKDTGPASDLLWGGGTRSHPVSTRVAQEFIRNQKRCADLGAAYCRTLAPSLRHRLGEHYTPSWLVRQAVTRARKGAVIADPACGDGRFLVALLELGHDPEHVWGADLSPLAVVMARINVWRTLGSPSRIPRVSVLWADFVLGPDFADPPPPISTAVRALAAAPVTGAYVGNPPWVTWRNLSEEYRAALASRIAHSRLHHTRGWSARVSAGQTDLAHVFVHEAIERVTQAGAVSFVLPRTTFKAPVGPARLREGISTSGRRYRFVEVRDYSMPDPFTGVRAEAVLAHVEVDRPHTFPVPWFQGSPCDPNEHVESQAILSDPDDVSSPWLTGRFLRPVQLAMGERWAELRARGGVNTGGGNSVFHVEVLARSADTVTIRNIRSPWQPVDLVVADVEAAQVRPLLRGKDVRAWSTTPSRHILFPHDVRDLRKPLPEPDLAATAPGCYAYLLRFKDFLSSRKELTRWQTNTWFALFRIGPYTIGCWRVVWPHSANRKLRAAVLGPDDPAVPDQKVVLVPFDDRDPALFLGALLNSTPVREAASRSGGLDASPNLVRRVPLPRYDPDDVLHGRLVAVAAAAAAGDPDGHRRADELASRLFIH